MSIKTSDSRRAVIEALRPGKPHNLFGASIKKMSNGLYQLNGQKQLLTLSEVMARLPVKIPQSDSIPDTPIYPDWLRCMSQHLPYAWATAKGYKEEEYRSKTTQYRGRFLIHASSTKASDALIQEWRIPQNEQLRGAIIGAAVIVDSFYDEEGAVHVLKDSIWLPKPVQPVSGLQAQLWKPQNVQHVRAFNQAWQQIQDLIK